MTIRISTLSACLALALAGCGGQSTPPAADTAATPAAPAAAPTAKVVHVYNWSDYVAEDTLKKFEDATGIRVIYDVYDSNEILEAKLMARNSGYDVVFRVRPGD